MLVFGLLGAVWLLAISWNEPPFDPPGFFSTLLILTLVAAGGATFGGTLFFVVAAGLLTPIYKIMDKSPFAPILGVNCGHHLNSNSIQFKFKNNAVGEKARLLNANMANGKFNQGDSLLECPICHSQWSSLNSEILEESWANGRSDDLQVFCLKCSHLIPKYDLMKLLGKAQEPDVFIPKEPLPREKLLHQIQFVPDDQCWFCRGEIENSKFSYWVPMYGNVQTVEDGEEVIPVNWGEKKIEVPRCASCKELHGRRTLFKKNITVLPEKISHEFYPTIIAMKAHGWVIGESPLSN
jgi:hypothetical protein